MVCVCVCVFVCVCVCDLNTQCMLNDGGKIAKINMRVCMCEKSQNLVHRYCVGLLLTERHSGGLLKCCLYVG
jgi:hypothetical protein